MPLDVINFAASEVILRNGPGPVEPATAARLSIAASLLPGIAGLLVPIIAVRSQASVGGGRERIAVPDVTGNPLDDASATLKADRLLAQPRRVFSNEVEKGTVIRQVPAGGEDVPENFPVQLTVSDGPPPDGDDGNDVVTTEDLEAAKLELEARIDELGAKIDALGKRLPPNPPAQSPSMPSKVS
jgi:hypothetical protein